MKSPAAGKREDLFDDFCSCVFDVFLHRSQVARINDEQEALSRRWPFRPETASQSPVKKARVIGPVIFEFPSENFSVKLFGSRYVSGRYFNVVDLSFRFWFAHGWRYYKERFGSDCKYRPGVDPVNS